MKRAGQIVLNPFPIRKYIRRQIAPGPRFASGVQVYDSLVCMVSFK